MDNSDSDDLGPLPIAFIAGGLSYAAPLLVFMMLFGPSNLDIRGISGLDFSMMTLYGAFGGINVEYGDALREGSGNLLPQMGTFAIIIIAVAAVPLVINGYWYTAGIGPEIGSFGLSTLFVSGAYAVISCLGALVFGREGFEIVTNQSIGATTIGGSGTSAQFEITDPYLAQADPVVILIVSFILAVLCCGLGALFAKGGQVEET